MPRASKAARSLGLGAVRAVSGDAVDNDTHKPVSEGGGRPFRVCGFRGADEQDSGVKGFSDCCVGDGAVVRSGSAAHSLHNGQAARQRGSGGAQRLPVHGRSGCERHGPVGGRGGVGLEDVVKRGVRVG